MAGYLGFTRGVQSLVGPTDRRAPATGWGLLARDTTALEEDVKGWTFPPWGYSRNRPIDNAPPRSLLSGFGSLGGTNETAAMVAANEYVRAIEASFISGVSKLPDYSVADFQVAKIADPNLMQAVSGYATAAYNAMRNIKDYGDNADPVQPLLDALRKIASGVMPETVAGDEWTAVDPSLAKTDAEELSLFQQFAMSDAGAATIKGGAFTSGFTGINQDAILEEGKRSDIDVASYVEAGQKAGSFTKWGLYAAIGVGAYFGLKKIGVL